MRSRAPIYAGRLERLFANLLDTIILLFPSAILIMLLGTGGITMILSFLSSLAYYVYFTASSWQATPGKRTLGIYVIRTDHRALNQRDALERFLAYAIPSLPMYSSFLPADSLPIIVFWLSIFWFAPILFTPERIGYHDRLCHTRVVVGKVGT